MAEIPVEKKSAFPIWLIPLALIALIGVSALAYNTMNTPAPDTQTTSSETHTSEMNTNRENDVTTTTTTTTQERIVNVNVFSETADKSILVGREVLLESVPVARVLSDRIFTVVSGNTEFFALLDPSLDSAGGNEANVAVKAGDTRSLVGEFKAVPTADLKEEQATDLPLDSEEYKQLQNEKVYLHVTQLNNETAGQAK